MEKIERMKFWVQKVLPLVYDDSLSYYEVLCKVVAKLNEVIDSENELKDIVSEYVNLVNLLSVNFNDFKTTVNNKFAALDLELVELLASAKEYTDSEILKVVQMVNDLDSSLTDFVIEKIANEENRVNIIVGLMQDDINDLSLELANFVNGNYVTNYIDKLEVWIKENIALYVRDIVKYVFFGLSDDGYFYSDIPNSWDFINLSTDLTDENFGKLILEY